MPTSVRDTIKVEVPEAPRTSDEDSVLDFLSDLAASHSSSTSSSTFNAELRSSTSSFKHRFDSPEIKDYIQNECTPIASTSAQPYPITPPATPSLSRDRKRVLGPFTALEVAPAIPCQAEKQPKSIPLANLIPAGVIVLRSHSSLTIDGADGTEIHSDGWRKLRASSVWSTEPPPYLSEELQLRTPESLNSPPDLELDPVKSPRTPSTHAKGKRRKNSKASRASPAKRRRGSIESSSRNILADILHLQDALVISATFLTLENDVVVRIYLVPLDLTLAQLGGQKKRRIRPADSLVMSVFSQIQGNFKAWNGNLVDDAPSMFGVPDNKSLLELYREIPSPSADPKSFEALEGCSEDIREELAHILSDGPDGLKTELFPYQKASLAKMLAREWIPQRVPAPSYSRIQSTIDHSLEFFISVEGKVYLEPPTVLEPRGGLLAEEMGTGKTLICLSLVLATFRSMPNVSSVCCHLDGSPSHAPVLMTAVAEDFPFQPFCGTQERLRPRIALPLQGYEMSAHEQDEYNREIAFQAVQDAQRETKPLPSLRSLMIHYVKTRSIDYDEDDDPRLQGCLSDLSSNIPFYYVFPSSQQLDSREGRKGSLKPMKVLVSRATLAVVPTDLVSQWKDQLQTHVKESRLRVLVLRTSKDVFPPAAHLVNFDLIILSVARFTDAADDLKSPLRNIHWKRLIVDEGHTLSGANMLRKLASELRCEARWAISGTPTTNLRGADDDGALFAASSTIGGAETDFQKLGELYSRFLHHEAFVKPDAFRHTFTVPILHQQRGSERLANLLNRSIVRNAPQEIKEAYTLPPLTSQVIYLSFLEQERKTYNALLGLFASNSIQSQRIDQDYLFAPQQKKHLDELVLNLSTSSFFFASDGMIKFMKDAVEFSEERLASEKSKSWSDQDRQGLRKSISVMQEALSDREWCHAVTSTAVTIDIDGLDEELIPTFNAMISSSSVPAKTTIIPLGGLTQMRQDLKELRRPENFTWMDDVELVQDLITYERKRRWDVANPTLEPTLPQLKRKRGEQIEYRPLPDWSSFRQVTAGQTSSAKLNHVVSELRKYPESKFIIFCSTLTDLIFANLSEALDILEINHRVFAGSKGKRGDRGSLAAFFNNSTPQQCQALLLDAKLGGRGVHLTGADRVIMLEPIWIPDLEVQAVKRAHRLGQTKPVDVQVLVIRDSYEDELLKRRGQLSQSDFGKTKQPQRDDKLREMLQSAKYLDPIPTNGPVLSRTPVFRDDPTTLPAAKDNMAAESKPSISSLHPKFYSSYHNFAQDEAFDRLASSSPAKKVKKEVRFAD
ncbi:hypothetical protein T439DRAFT_329684 [Meredithblackwellia eburnea MCA 4105]